MELSQAIRELRGHIGRALVLHHLLNYLAVGGFVWGTLILALRAMWNVSPVDLLWVALLLPPLMIAALLHARRSMPSDQQLCALLDWQNRCGGLVMASQETELGGWQQQLPSLQRPQVRLRDGRAAVLFVAAAVFVAAGLLVPQSFVVPGEHKLDVGEEVKKLEDKIDTLAEEKIVDSPKAEAFKKRLRQLEQEARGEEPAKTWEALDHLESNLKKTAEEAAQKTVQNTEQLNQAETLAQALDQSGADMDQKLLKEAMAELGEMVQQAIKENEAASKYLDEQTKQSCQQGSLSKEQMKAIAAAMQKGKESNQQKLEKLCQSGMCNNKNMELNKQAGQSNSSALSEFLQQNTQNMTVSEMMTMAKDQQGKKFGRGGTDRGGDPAPMVFGEGSKEEGAAFKEEALPPATLEALKDSQRIGISTSAPDVEKAGTTSGVLGNNSGDHGSASTQTILPRHRQAIKQYFARTGEQK